MRVESKHFFGDPLSFLIVKEPLNGWIESRTHPGLPVLRFTKQQLQVNIVKYQCFGTLLIKTYICIIDNTCHKIIQMINHVHVKLYSRAITSTTFTTEVIH